MFTPGRTIGFVIFLIVLIALGILLARLDTALRPFTDDGETANNPAPQPRVQASTPVARQGAARAKSAGSRKGRR